MNEIPTSNEEPDETDDRYRRLSARDSSAPSEAVRRAVLRHAAELAAQTPGAKRPADSSAAKRTRRRIATYGGLAAAATLAGLLTVPRFWTPPAAPAGRLPAAAPAPITAPSSSTAPPPAAQVNAPRAEEKTELAQNSLAERRASAAQAPPLPSSAAAPRAFSLSRAESLVNPQAALREAAQRGDVAAIRRLLAEKLDVDARDAGGRTALMFAVLQGRRQAVETLLAAGADPNAADASGTTPLQAAHAGSHPAIAAALEQSGAR